jgi:hypothetical protein
MSTFEWMGLRKAGVWAGLASIVLLMVAVFGRRPYSFYVFMRFVACGSAAYLAVGAHRDKSHLWTWVMGAVALLFNPLVPVHMSRHDWQRLDVVGAFVFAIYLVIFTFRSKNVL